MRKLFPGTFQDFNFDILKMLRFLENIENTDYTNTFVTGFRSPSPVRLCPSCLRRFGDLRKKHALEFWSMYLVDFVICCRLLSILGSSKWYRHRMTPTTPTTHDDDDEPTTAMPHSHRQANTHRDQISRSGETPSL